MTIYYSLMMWIGLVSLFSKNINNNQKRKGIVVIFCCMGIFLVQALRSRIVGVDVAGYLRGYQIVDNINILAGERLFNYEIGYILYSKAFSIMNLNDQWYLTVVALTIIVPIAYTWHRYSKLPELSIFIYITLVFFTMSFSGLRQSIAMAILFYSFRFIQEKNLFKFLITVLIAMSFHFSAIVFIAAYPLYYIKISDIHIIFVIPSLIITFLLREDIYLLFHRLYKGLPGEIVYTGAYTMFFVMFFIWLLSYVFGDKYKQNLTFNAYKNYILAATFIQALASQSNIIMRTGFYYFLFVTLLIPEVIEVQKDKKMKLLAISFLVLILLYRFQITLNSGYLDITPYYFYWE